MSREHMAHVRDFAGILQGLVRFRMASISSPRSAKCSCVTAPLVEGHMPKPIFWHLTQLSILHLRAQEGHPRLSAAGSDCVYGLG